MRPSSIAVAILILATATQGFITDDNNFSCPIGYPVLQTVECRDAQLYLDGQNVSNSAGCNPANLIATISGEQIKSGTLPTVFGSDSITFTPEYFTLEQLEQRYTRYLSERYKSEWERDLITSWKLNANRSILLGKDGEPKGVCGENFVGSKICWPLVELHTRDGRCYRVPDVKDILADCYDDSHCEQAFCDPDSLECTDYGPCDTGEDCKTDSCDSNTRTKGLCDLSKPWYPAKGTCTPTKRSVECCDSRDCPKTDTCQDNLCKPKSAQATTKTNPPVSSATRCLSDNDCNTREVCSKGTCKPAKLTIAYVAVGQDANERFIHEAETQHSFFVNTMPTLLKCQDLIRPIILSTPCNVSFTGQFDRVLEDTNRCVKTLLTGDFDYFIGIAPNPSFWKSDNIIGFTIPNTTAPGAMTTNGNEITAAHELGHLFGLADEYCKGGPQCNIEPNPLQANLGCDPNGNCCWSTKDLLPHFRILSLFPLRISFATICPNPYNYGYCCDGNLNAAGGISIMSWGDSPGPRLHDQISTQHLERQNITCEG